MTGHAVEARIYAEDPSHDFLPSVGKLEICRFPLTALEDNGVRIDSAVSVNNNVSIYYDPMIAKIICHDENRTKAIASLSGNLGAVHIYPVKSNVEFLILCLGHKEFRQGILNTNFIADNADAFIKPAAFTVKSLKNLASQIFTRVSSVDTTPFGTQNGWRLNTAPRISVSYLVNGDDVTFEYSRKTHKINCRVLGYIFKNIPTDPREIYNMHGAAFDVNDTLVLFTCNTIYEVKKSGSTDDLQNRANGGAITAPMPGKIIAVNAAIGDNVKAGDKLIIMEAMKMEMSLEAPRDGIVASVNCAAGGLVSDGEILLELETEDTP